MALGCQSLNINFQYLTATDKIANEEKKMSGGFIGANVFILPEKLVGFTRYDFIKVDQEKTNQFTIGLRYHLAPNVFVTGEFTNSKTGDMMMNMFMFMTHFLF